MNNYRVANEILEAGIPTLAFTISIDGFHSEESLDNFVEQEISNCIEKYSNADLKENNIIAGYHILHDRHGEKSKKITPAPETLIKLITRKGVIPRINPLVDIYNLISTKYALALGAHDLDKLQSDVVLRFALGNEIFIPLGSTHQEQVFVGEYGYFDSVTNEVLCRLEARQGNKTKISKDSKVVLLIIQGNENTSAKYLFEAKGELLTNLQKFVSFTLVKEFDFLSDY